MNFYRDTSGVFHRTQADAKASGLSFEQTNVDTSQQGLVDFFNELLAGASPPVPELPASDPVPAAPPPQPTPSYTEWSVGLEEAWDKLPLPHKLHFAALAMEEARNHVGSH